MDTRVFNQDALRMKKNEPVFYIYDRVTTRPRKDAEMRKRYGVPVSRRSERSGNAGKYTQSSENFQTMKYAAAHTKSFPRTPPKEKAYGKTADTYRGAEKSRFASQHNGETNPQYVRYDCGSDGAAAVRSQRNFRDSIVHFFDTIEERWQHDVDAAKKQAAMHRKFVEHRRGLLLAVVMLSILALFVFGVYHLFFVIRHVDVEESSVYSAEQIQESAGIRVGNTLYSFRTEDAQDAITFCCPYIRSATIDRTIPNRITITTENDTIRYYAEIYGETVALSSGLRVLGTITEEDAKANGAILLHLPAVKRAVAGRVLVFQDTKKERAIRELLTAAEESVLSNRIGMIDVRDEQNILMNCDDTYRLEFGTVADADLKLRMANKTISDSLFETGMLARIDLSITGIASVQYDLRLDLNSTD